MEEDKTALASTSFQGVFDRIEAIIGRVIDVIAASLLLFDIVILLWAIGARYLLRAPVTWVEELATVVFLWFGMLGVASALTHSEGSGISESFLKIDAADADHWKGFDVLLCALM
jgi:TRAP-type mannitol/chloroaromatic compound transport system permease small subunit